MLAEPVKVIVAEDSALQRSYLCSLISALGYDAIEAEDGAMALDLVSRTNAPIVISDLQMPNLDGIALTRKIRALELGHYVHVFMVTETDDVQARAESLKVGVDDFIPKGSSPDVLKVRLRTATRLINHAAELAQRTEILKAANARIEADLRAAAAAQQQLLPSLQDDIMGFGVASTFVPSAIVSGDMFGCFAVCDDTLAFYAVDVSGHGVHASLLSVAIGHLITPDYVRAHGFDASGRPDPAAMVGTLNERFGTAENDDYFTMFVGLINTRTGQMAYCQAGYPAAIYVAPCGETVDVGAGGLPVGIVPFATYETQFHPFEVGASLIICSDAAPEAVNLSGQPFGLSRLHAIAKTAQNIGTRNIPDTIIQSLSAWRGDIPLEDDLTVVTLERKTTHDPK